MNTSKTIPEIKERQRIMVMNNDQDMLRLLNRTLETEGFDTIVVADDEEASNLLDTIKPDMVIMDTIEPDSGSLHAIDCLRRHSDVPIIVLTSDNEMETLREVFAHGADDFIRKPFNAKLFIARVKAKLRRYHQTVRQ
jgi:two-component system, OmpR family, response regulator